MFPPDADIPVAAVARYWTHSRSSTEAETRTDLDRLAKAKVLQHAGDRIGFHDLQHDYLLLHAPNLAVLHAELLAAYRHLLPADTVDRWWQLPDDEPYLRDHLVEHLGSAGERRSLAITVTDPAYHVQRIAHDGVHASVADLDTASRFLGKSRATWWAGWLVRHAHLLDRRRSCTVTQLRRRNTAATVKAWLEAERHQSADMDTTGLDALLSQPHLALVGGLSAPSENLVRILTGHASSIAAVAWSPDGTHLATAGDDQTVRIWNRTTGETTATLTGHVGPGAYGGLVARRHPVGRRRRRQVGPDLGPHHRSDRHDPHRPHPLGGRGRLVARRHPAGHRQRRQDRPDLGLDHRRDTDRSPGHTSWVNAVAWSPDGTYLATSDSNGVIILWTRRGDESTSITIQAASSLAWSRTGLAVVFDLACSR